MNIFIFILSSQNFDGDRDQIISYIQHNALLHGKFVSILTAADIENRDFILDNHDASYIAIIKSMSFQSLRLEVLSRMKVIYLNHSIDAFNDAVNKFIFSNLAGPIKKEADATEDTSVLQVGPRDKFSVSKFERFEPYLYFPKKLSKPASYPLGIDFSMHCHSSEQSQFVLKRFDVSGFQSITHMLSTRNSMVRKPSELGQSDDLIDFLLSPPVVKEHPLDFINKNICDSRTADVFRSVGKINEVVGGIDIFINPVVIKNISLSYNLLCTEGLNTFHLVRSKLGIGAYAKYKLFIVGHGYRIEELSDIIFFDMCLPNTLFLYDEIFFNDIEKMIGEATDALCFYKIQNLACKISDLQDKVVRQATIEKINIAYSKCNSRSIKQLVLRSLGVG